jgi:hypothetical protein
VQLDPPAETHDPITATRIGSYTSSSAANAHLAACLHGSVFRMRPLSLSKRTSTQASRAVSAEPSAGNPGRQTPADAGKPRRGKVLIIN